MLPMKKKIQSHEDRIAALVRALKKREPMESQDDENKETPEEQALESKFGIEQHKNNSGEGLMSEDEDMSHLGAEAESPEMDEEEIKKGRLFGTPQKHEVHIKISLHGKK